MRYFLKKDLPGIKAGTEMAMAKHICNVWFSKDNRSAYIPDSELSDWIQEKESLDFVECDSCRDDEMLALCSGCQNNKDVIRILKDPNKPERPEYILSKPEFDKYIIKSAKEWQERQ